jgi:hypothetical protein
MRVAIAQAEKLKPRPHICDVMTDGYTPWPKVAPAEGMRVLALILKGGRYGYDASIPEWMDKVEVTLPE